MGCIKLAYVIRRVKKFREESPLYPINKQCHIAAEMIGASEWDAELITLLMKYCPEEAIKWAKYILESTRKQINAIDL